MFRRDGQTPAKKKTILHWLLLPIVAVMLAQAFLYILVFWKGGVVNHADQNAYDILNERVLGRKQYIENEMVHRWSNLHEHETAILATIEETEENGLLWRILRPIPNSMRRWSLPQWRISSICCAAIQ
ncbi:MAG: hypothetical protein ACLRVT_00905 [Oscillospiraceae bacterium]